jgi:integrase
MNGLLKSKEAAWRNPKHQQQWVMTLTQYAKPLHSLPVAEIRVADIKEALTPHWTARPETADRLRARIAAVLDYAEANELRHGANPARKDVIDKVMLSREMRKDKHHAALAYNLVSELMRGLKDAVGVAAKAVAFMVLTVGRTGEIRGATFDEIDFTDKVWNVPASRMKAKTEHRVPLCDRAIQIVEDLRKQATSNYIFCGSHDGKPISDTAMTKALRLHSPDKTATLHGLRSSFKDWATEVTNYPNELSEQALAHVTGTKVERAYRRGDALDKRRELINDWAQYCQQ